MFGGDEGEMVGGWGCTRVGVEVVVVFQLRPRLLLGEVVVFDFFELDHFGCGCEGLWALDAVL